MKNWTDHPLIGLAVFTAIVCAYGFAIVSGAHGMSWLMPIPQ